MLREGDGDPNSRAGKGGGGWLWGVTGGRAQQLIENNYSPVGSSFRL